MRERKTKKKNNNTYQTKFAGANLPQKEEPNKFLMALPLLGRLFRVEQTLNRMKYHCDRILEVINGNCRKN